MDIRSILVTTKERRLIISVALVTFIFFVLISVDLLKVRGDWVVGKQAYTKWMEGSEKQNCELLFNDATRRFNELNCENASQSLYVYSCSNPVKENRINEINSELLQSGCPINKFSADFGGIVSLYPPVDPESFITFFSKYHHLTSASDTAIRFLVYVLLLFFLLGLVRLIILEKNVGWFRLTILLSVLSAIVTPLYCYIGEIETESFIKLAVYSMLSLVGTAALMIYGRITFIWVYSGFRGQLAEVNDENIQQSGLLEKGSVTPCKLETACEHVVDNGSDVKLQDGYHRHQIIEKNTTNDDSRYCAKCGAENVLSSLFCYKCGHLITLSQTVRSEASSVSIPRLLPSNELSASILIPGFIGKHWRGEYSLAVSYWFVGICTVIVSKGIVKLTNLLSSEFNLGTRMSGTLIMLLFGVVLLLTAWQLIGVWRSADKHVQRGGNPIWVGIAKLMVVIGLIGAASSLFTQEAVLAEGARMLLGKDNISPYSIRVIGNGTELELSGGMPFGTTEAIEKALRSSPSVRVIHLNSVGGRINEGYKLYSLIREKKLITYTSTECASACTVAFLAGKEKYLGENGKLGFHSSSIGGQEGEVVQNINNDIRKTLKSSGVPDDFINHALSISSKDIWFPTKQELLQANVIDSVVDSRYFGMSAIGQWVDAFQIENSMLKIPFYSALATYDKNNFARLRNTLVIGLQKGKSQIDIQADIRKILFGELFPNYLRSAPDRELIAYWRSQIEQMAYLKANDPQLCADFAFPEYAKSARDFQSLMPLDYKNRYWDALSEMVKAASVNPQGQISNTVINADLRSTMRKVYNKLPIALNLFQNPARFRNAPVSLCDASIEIYSEILALPSVSRTGQLLRYMHRE